MPNTPPLQPSGSEDQPNEAQKTPEIRIPRRQALEAFAQGTIAAGVLGVMGTALGKAIRYQSSQHSDMESSHTSVIDEPQVVEHAHEHQETLEPLTEAQVAEHLENNMELVRAEQLVSGELPEDCVDGRENQRKVIATPGGIMGEMALAESALRTMGADVNGDVTNKLMDFYAETTGVLEHTDGHALELLHHHLLSHPTFRDDVPLHFNEFIEWHRRGGDNPENWPALLTIMQDPRFVGCGHMKLMLEAPGEYELTKEIITAQRSEFFRRLWSGDERMHWVIVEGDHNEKGVAVLHVRGEINDRTELPAIQPYGEDGHQLFVYHPEARLYVADHLSDRVLEAAGMDTNRKEELMGHMQSIHGKQLAYTLKNLASSRGKPMYDATLEANGHFTVNRAGNAPDQPAA